MFTLIKDLTQIIKNISVFRTSILPKYDSTFENYRMILVRENYLGEKVSQTGTGRVTGGRNLYFKVKIFFRSSTASRVYFYSYIRKI